MKNTILTKSEVTLFTCFAIALIILGVRLHLIDLYGGATPYWDDWGLGNFLYEYHTIGRSFTDYFTPVNGHRLFFTRVLNVVLFTFNENQWDPLLSMTANAVIWTLSGFFLLLVARGTSKVIPSHIFILIIMILWIFPTALVNVVWAAQSHNYFMILFVLIGCWLVDNEPFSVKWLFGIGALFAACLTMGGGSFASVAVVTVYLLKAMLDRERRKQHLQTVATVVIVAVFGLCLIVLQEKTGNRFATKNIGDFLITLVKTLSWPLSKSSWLCLVFFAPVLLVAIKSLKSADEKIRKLSTFILCLSCFVGIVAIAIAYARGAGGHGPTRRYAEFLSLSIVSSFLAVLVLQQRKDVTQSIWNKPLLLGWFICLIATIPTLFGIFQHTAKERKTINSASEQIALDYILTGDIRSFKNKRYLHMPFPNHKRLAKWLDNFSRADILPIELQIPQMNTEIEGNAFTQNGIYFSQAGNGYRGEDVIGSFNKNAGFQIATGTYQSEEFISKRSYLVIPTLGYLGREGLSLSLIGVISGKRYLVDVEAKSSKFAGWWRLKYINAPDENYRIEATDKSETKWFAFAAPRNMGRLSYFSRWIIGKGKYIWQAGAVLFLLSLHNQILNIFRFSDRRV